MQKPKTSKILSIFLSALLLFQQTGLAQVASSVDISGKFASLRQSFSPEARYRPLHLRYLSFDSANNNFKLLIDKGSDKNFKTSDLENASRDLLKYFFIGLALPNETFWVNLRPDSPDQIIDPLLEQTDIGRILLEADVELKKDTALATSPDTKEGKVYWDKLYQKAEELYGTNEVTIPTLTRPWIVPDEVIISENQSSAYIYKATLKVMLEEDYLKSTSKALKGYSTYDFKDDRAKELNEYSTQLLKELVIPKITQTINTSKKYASLRQVYYSLILAQWFKAKFQSTSAQGSGAQVNAYNDLINSKDLSNLTSEIPYSKDTYFKQYQKSFQNGEYKFDLPVSTPQGQSIRSYFSGGALFAEAYAGAVQVPSRGNIPRNPNVTGVEVQAGPEVLKELGIMCTGDAGVNVPKRAVSPVASEAIINRIIGKNGNGGGMQANDVIGRGLTGERKEAEELFTDGSKVEFGDTEGKWRRVDNNTISLNTPPAYSKYVIAVRGKATGRFRRIGQPLLEADAEAEAREAAEKRSKSLFMESQPLRKHKEKPDIGILELMKIIGPLDSSRKSRLGLQISFILDTDSAIKDAFENENPDVAGWIAVGAFQLQSFKGAPYYLKISIEECFELGWVDEAAKLIVAAMANRVPGISAQEIAGWVKRCFDAGYADSAVRVAMEGLRNNIDGIDPAIVKTAIDNYAKSGQVVSSAELSLEAIKSRWPGVSSDDFRSGVTKCIDKALFNAAARLIVKAFKARLVGIRASDIREWLGRLLKHGHVDSAQQVISAALRSGLLGITAKDTAGWVESCLQSDQPEHAGEVILAAFENDVPGIDTALLNKTIKRCLERGKAEEASQLIVRAMYDNFPGIGAPEARDVIDRCFELQHPGAAGMVAVESVVNKFDGVSVKDIRRSVWECLKRGDTAKANQVIIQALRHKIPAIKAKYFRKAMKNELRTYKFRQLLLPGLEKRPARILAKNNYTSEYVSKDIIYEIFKNNVPGIKAEDVRLAAKYCFNHKEADLAFEIIKLSLENKVPGISVRDIRNWADRLYDLDIQLPYFVHRAARIVLAAIRSNISGILESDVRAWVDEYYYDETFSHGEFIPIEAFKNRIAGIDADFVRETIEEHTAGSPDETGRFFIDAIKNNVPGIGPEDVMDMVNQCFEEKDGSFSALFLLSEALENRVSGIGIEEVRGAIKRAAARRDWEDIGYLGCQAIINDVQGVSYGDVATWIKACFDSGSYSTAGDIALEAIKRGIPNIDFGNIKKVIDECMAHGQEYAAGMLIVEAAGCSVPGIGPSELKAFIERLWSSGESDLAGNLAFKAFEDKINGIDASVILRSIENCLREGRLISAAVFIKKAIEYEIPGFDKTDLRSIFEEYLSRTRRSEDPVTFDAWLKDLPRAGSDDRKSDSEAKYNSTVFGILENTRFFPKGSKDFTGKLIAYALYSDKAAEIPEVLGSFKENPRILNLLRTLARESGWDHMVEEIYDLGGVDRFVRLYEIIHPYLFNDVLPGNIDVGDPEIKAALEATTRFNLSYFKEGFAFEEIYKQFKEDYNNRRIAVLPRGIPDRKLIEVTTKKQQEFTLDAQNFFIELMSPVRDALATMSSTSNAKLYEGCLNKLAEGIRQEVASLGIKKSKPGLPATAVNNIEKQIGLLRAAAEKTSLSVSKDDFPFGNLEAGELDAIGRLPDAKRIARTCLFIYVFKNNPSWLAHFKSISNQSLSAENLRQVITFAESVLRPYLLNSLSPAVRKAMLSYLNVTIFENELKNLSGEYGSLKRKIRVVPCRGWLAEFIGYYSDECWTRTQNILRDNPDAIPLILVDDETEELLGGTLLMPNSINGEKVLIDRGLSPRIEVTAGLDVEDFVNQVLDFEEQIARRLGASKILVSYGNREDGIGTNNIDIKSYYERILLRTPFVNLDIPNKFNGHDITKGKCFVLRQVSKDSSAEDLQAERDPELIDNPTIGENGNGGGMRIEDVLRLGLARKKPGAGQPALSVGTVAQAAPQADGWAEKRKNQRGILYMGWVDSIINLFRRNKDLKDAIVKRIERLSVARKMSVRTLPVGAREKIRKVLGPLGITPPLVVVMRKKDMGGTEGPLRRQNSIYVGDGYNFRHDKDISSVIPDLGREELSRWIMEEQRSEDRSKKVSAEEADRLAGELEQMFTAEGEAGIAAPSVLDIQNARPVDIGVMRGFIERHPEFKNAYYDKENPTYPKGCEIFCHIVGKAMEEEGIDVYAVQTRSHMYLLVLGAMEDGSKKEVVIDYTADQFFGNKHSPLIDTKDNLKKQFPDIYGEADSRLLKVSEINFDNSYLIYTSTFDIVDKWLKSVGTTPAAPVEHGVSAPSVIEDDWQSSMLTFNPESTLDAKDEQKQLVASGEPLEFGPGLLYHGRNGLDEAVISGELAGEIKLTRAGHRFATGYFAKRRSASPAVFVFKAEVFNRLARGKKADLKMIGKDPYPRIRVPVLLDDISEIWIDEVTSERYAKVMLDPRSDADFKLKAGLEKLYAAGKIKAIPGLRHTDFLKGGPEDWDAVEELVGKYMMSRGLFKSVPELKLVEDPASAAAPVEPFGAAPSAPAGKLGDDPKIIDMKHRLADLEDSLNLLENKLAEEQEKSARRIKEGVLKERKYGGHGYAAALERHIAQTKGYIGALRRHLSWVSVDPSAAAAGPELVPWPQWEALEPAVLSEKEDEQLKLLQDLSTLAWAQMSEEELAYLKAFVTAARSEFPQYLSEQIIKDALNNPGGAFELLRRSHPYTLEVLRAPDQITHQFRLHEGMYYRLFAMRLLGIKPQGPVIVMNVDPHADTDSMNRLSKDTDSGGMARTTFWVRGVLNSNWATAAIRDGLADAVIIAGGNPTSEGINWFFYLLSKDENGEVFRMNMPRLRPSELLKNFPRHQIYLTVDLDQFGLLREQGNREEPVVYTSTQIKDQMELLFDWLKGSTIVPFLVTADSREYLDRAVDEDWISQARQAVKNAVEAHFTSVSPAALEDPLGAAPSAGGQELASSAPENSGGIDFRSMPIVSRAMANLSSGAAGISMSQLRRMDLDKEWSDIEQMVSSGIAPSGERIKEYLQASSAKGQLDSDVDKVLTCISDILRQDEEKCCSSDETIKDILIVLEASRSPAELVEVFVGAGIS